MIIFFLGGDDDKSEESVVLREPTVVDHTYAQHARDIDDFGENFLYFVNSYRFFTGWI